MKPAVAIQEIVHSQERLRAMTLPEEDLKHLINLVQIAHFRLCFGENRSTLVGMIGCTGAGKSTIFNSLAGRNVSETSWKAHNTRNPSLLAHPKFREHLKYTEEQSEPLLLPRFDRVDNAAAVHPAPETLTFASLHDDAWRDIALLDLPDINSTLAQEEHSLAREIQPWLDAVIFILDEETLFHRDYEAPAVLAKELGQERICVINHRGSDRIDLEHPDIDSVRRLFDVDHLFVLPVIANGPRFTHEKEFLQLREAVLAIRGQAPTESLIRMAAPLARQILLENKRRRDLFDQYRKALQKEIQTALRSTKPISLRQIMNDEALQIMEHLGLRRFAVGNVARFFRRIASTGSLKRSYQLSFGSRREDAARALLRFDAEKLSDELSSRIRDHIESVQSALRRSGVAKDIYTTAPMLRNLTVGNEERLREEAESMLKELEEHCHTLLASDTLQSAFKNDPITAAAVIVALIADWITIPGFGSFALAPTAIRYLPIGQFELARRRFQQAARESIHNAVRDILEELNRIRERLILEESSPLAKALESITDYYETA